MLEDPSPRKPKTVTFRNETPSRLNRRYVAPQASVRQCTLVRNVPDTTPDMPAQTHINTQIKNKKEVEAVSEKVAKTKTEIEQLKAELEQLIKDGINKNDFSETTHNLNTFTELKGASLEVLGKGSVKEIKSKVKPDVFHDPQISKPKVHFSPEKKSKTIKLVPHLNPPAKKVRHYDQVVARDYIKKQREKRREELNNRKKDVVSVADIKRQRLQELREKSLKLITKNVNRARSRSRSREKVISENRVESAVSCEPLQDNPQNECISSQVLNKNFKLIHPHLQNITIRSPHSYDDKIVDLNLDDKERVKAAIIIQAAFRGYRQRKLFKIAKRKELIKKVSREVQTNAFQAPKVNVVPYPYNFINAVKRKLHLVTQQTKISNDPVIPACKSPNLDLKSFLSNKCLNLDVKLNEQLSLYGKSKSASRTTVENGCASESDTSKNIPDLSSEDSISEVKLTYSSKRAFSSDTDEERKLGINVDRVKKLKLRQPKRIETEILEHISRRSSIISFNKCNYPVPSKSETERKSEASIVKTDLSITNGVTVSARDVIKEIASENVGETYSLENKENLPEVTNLIDKPSKASQEYSSNFTSIVSELPLLKPPSVSLKSSLPLSGSEETDSQSESRKVTNIKLKHGEKTFLESTVKTNEIHLKFEAELHLLNDFNDSLRQFMAVEKSLLELHNKKNEAAMNFHTRDTQTSVINPQSQIATINYSRGSDVTEALSIDNDVTFITTGLELSPFNSPLEESCSDNSIAKEKLINQNCFAGISLEMFEQLIKDEDARIENLKAVLKIREKALVDRTKGELAWLEIQKKDLRDGGQLQEISAIKKKQRGLLIKLEHERHEMQRLKQMQKAASRERKSVLKEQRKMIKAQLYAGNTATKIKRHAREEKRQSGPIKVYNIKSHSDTILSETSVTRRSSVTEDVVSTVSHSIVSQDEAILSEKLEIRTSKETTIHTETVKRSLLMREAALQKRRKVAEELLQWHQRLVEEEKKISELELAATTIINQGLSVNNEHSNKPTRQIFQGSQLNQLWFSMTGRQEKKFRDEEMYNMSQTSLEKFCNNAKNYEKTHKKHNDPKLNKAKSIPLEENINSEISEYLSDFESVITSGSPILNGALHSDSSESDEINTITEISKQRNEIIDQKSSSVENKFAARISSFNKSKSDTDKTSNKTSMLEDAEANQTDTIKDDGETRVSLMSSDDSSNTNENNLPWDTSTNNFVRQLSNSSASSKSGKNVEVQNSQSASTTKSLSAIETLNNKTNNIKSNESSENSMLQKIFDEESEIQPLTTPTDFGSKIADLKYEISEKGKSKEPSLSSITITKTKSNQGNEQENLHRISIDNNLDKNQSVSQTIDKTEIKEQNHTSTNEKVGDAKSGLINSLSGNKISNLVSSKSSTATSTSQLNHSSLLDQILSKSNTPSTISKTPLPTNSLNESDGESALKLPKEFIHKTSSISELLSKTEGDALSVKTSDSSNIIKTHQNNYSSAEVSAGQTLHSDTSQLVSEVVDDPLADYHFDNTNQELQSEEIPKEDEEQLLSTEKSKSDEQVNDTSSEVQTQPRVLLSSYGFIDKKSESNPTISLGIFKGSDNITIPSDDSESQIQDQIDVKKLSFSDLALSTKSLEIEKDNTNENVKSSLNLSSIQLDERINEDQPTKNDFTQIISETSEIKITDADLSSRGQEKLSNSPIEEDDNQSSREKSDSVSNVSIGRTENKISETNLSSDRLEQNSIEQINSENVETKNYSDPSILMENEDKTESTSNQIEHNEKPANQVPFLASDALDENSKIKEIRDNDRKSVEKVTQKINEKPVDENQIDVKKRVLEILTDANISSPRGDRSPRMQDFYVTAYDVVSSDTSPDSSSPVEDVQSAFPTQNVSDEVEELLKKQLAIEQEIKEIQQQQQKEQLPYLYVREIPNKPPPPYTPPVTVQQSNIKDSILPIGEKQINLITKASAEILYKAFKANNLRNVTLSENSKKILDLKSNISGRCYEFIFDLAKEIAIEHYKQFEPEIGPSWMHLHKQTKLAIGKPLDHCGLDKLINKKIKQILDNEIVKTVENKKHKWSGKKRDHVDELLVVECQMEESEWTNYDRDELIVKDELTKDIMNMLLSETGQVLNNILIKKKNLS